MRYRTLFLVLLVVIAAFSTLACSSDDDDDGPTVFSGDTLTVRRTGVAISGAFLVNGAFNVTVTGDNVRSDNSSLLVYAITPEGNGFLTKRVAGSGPKAVAEGTTQHPGPILDLTFNLGPGEYYVRVDTAPENDWTMVIKGVSEIR